MNKIVKVSSLISLSIGLSVITIGVLQYTNDETSLTYTHIPDDYKLKASVGGSIGGNVTTIGGTMVIIPFEN
jgi:hypothetical protein